MNEIAELAEAINEEYAVSGILDHEKIANVKSITYSYNNYGDSFDGLLEYRDKNFHIYCNTFGIYTIDSPRVRFTFSHELGHYFIDEHRNALTKFEKLPSLCEYRSNNKIEKEADLFASHLLMPTKYFLEQIKRNKRKEGLELIISLSNYFRTSISSTAFRYVDLDLSSSAIIKWGVTGNLEWVKPSKSLTLLRLGRTIDNIKNSGKESASNRVIHQSNGILRNGTTLSIWFSNIDTNNIDRNSIYIEEAMKLGPYGYLTFLYPDRSQL